MDKTINPNLTNDRLKVSKKEKERVLAELKKVKVEFVECEEKGNKSMPNKKLPKFMNWENYPLYKVIFKKDGTTSLKLVRDGIY